MTGLQKSPQMENQTLSGHLDGLQNGLQKLDINITGE
jgi:hypothetical protein